MQERLIKLYSFQHL